jgi:hypothetical protein
MSLGWSLGLTEVAVKNAERMSWLDLRYRGAHFSGSLGNLALKPTSWSLAPVDWQPFASTMESSEFIPA